MRHALPDGIWRVAAIVSIATLWIGCSFDPAADVEFSSDESPWNLLDADSRDDAEHQIGIDTRLPDRPSDSGSSDGSMPGPEVDASTLPDAGEPDLSGPNRVCNGTTVDTSTSTAHCGACGNACDSRYGLCNGSTCECYDPYDPCGPNHECTLLDADPKNCGRCGIECGVGEVCFEGDCVCQPGLKRCSGECVDTEIDPRHCGDCNESCDDRCREGSCSNRFNCGVLWFDCNVSGSGVACLQPQPNALYCGPRIGNACGTVCDSAEICHRQGIFEPYRCREFRPAIGCTGCPCDDCDDGFCQESSRVDDLVFCIVR